MGRPDFDEGTQMLFSETTSLVGALAACLLSMLGMVGNTLTILALTQSRLRCHPTSLCLVALAVSDLVFCVFNLPLTAHQYFHRGCEFMCMDWHLCKYTPFFFFGNIGVSLMIMTLVAVHRFFGIFYSHLLSKCFNKFSMPLLLLACFFLAFGMMQFPLTETWGQFGYEPQSYSCTLMESEGHSFLPMMASLGVGLPTMVILASYTAIYCRVTTIGRATRAAARANDSDLAAGQGSVTVKTKQRERSLTVTFSVTFLAFLLCFLPWTLLAVLDPLPPSQLGWLHMISYILCWTSACINPVIYCLTNKYYRAAYIQLLSSLSSLCLAPPPSPPARATVSTSLTLPLQVEAHCTSLTEPLQGTIKKIDEDSF